MSRGSIVAAMFAAACHGAPAQNGPSAVLDAPFASSPVRDGASTKMIGVIVAPETVDIASRVPGVIHAISVQPGECVASGRKLIVMDDISLQEEVRAATAAFHAAEAAKREAEIEATAARRKRDSETQAFALGVSSRNEKEDAEVAFQRADVMLGRATALAAAEASRLETARDRLNQATIEAPFAGTVALRYKDPGATVSAGEPIVRIIKDGQSRVRFAVSPEELPSTRVGGRVKIQVQAVFGEQSATIVTIAPAVDAPSGKFFVEAELDQQAGTNLHPGLPASVENE